MKINWKAAAAVGGSILFALLAHMFFITESIHGRYMVGPNDGLAQMLPFKQFLYDQYTDGKFFYAFSFGLGGGTYSQLAYYFSTSIVYMFTLAVLAAGEYIGLLAHPDVLTWAEAIIPVSIIRMTIIILLTTYVFRYMRIPGMASFVGACFYAGSVIYFRHVTYWEFFANAFLWLPLLVLGAEKLIREQKPGWLIAAVAISVFDNFYFAYINFLFVGIYVLFRWCMKLTKGEASPFRQLRLFIPAILLGFGIGAISFVPAVYAFLNNYRPSFSNPIPFYEMEDNIFFTSRTLLLPMLFVLLACVPVFYRNRLFRMFGLLSILLILCQWSPRVASIFNGFSAPQYRYEYLTAFVIGGTIATGLALIQKASRRQLFIGAAGTALLYGYFFWRDDTLSLENEWVQHVFVALAVIVLLYCVYAVKRHRAAGALLLTAVIGSYLLLVNEHQEIHLSEAGNVSDSTASYLESADYNGQEQQELIQEVLNSDETVLPRIEWKTGDRNNTGLYQDFAGTSIYSSILNKQLLFFYYYDLEIDMKRESVSRYSGFGDRTNLYSLLNGEYIMYEKGEDSNVPSGFVRYMESDHYVVYQNQNQLPFAKVTDTVYSEDDLADKSVLEREHAMLNGIILQEEENTAVIETVPNLIEQSTVLPVNGSYYQNQLDIREEEGGVDILLPEGIDTSGDLYLSFYLENNDGTAPLFSLTVNEFQTSRKSKQSIYRTKADNITIRVKAADRIQLRLPNGSYTLKDLQLRQEDYQALANAADEAEEKDINVELNNQSIDVHYDNTEGDQYLKLPVPYEKGWTVTVNGEKEELLEADYAFLGVKLREGENDIVFRYYPPYSRILIWVSPAALIAAVCWIIWRRKKGKREEQEE